MKVTALLALLLAPTAQAAYPFTLDEAIARFSVDQAANCDFESDYEGAKAQRLENSTFTLATVGEKQVQVFDIWCMQGAYNVNSVFYLADEFGGLRAVQFASPVLNEKNKVIGFTTESWLTNASFNSANNELSFYAKGRGMGDCFAAGTYKLVDGNFTLKQYLLDATCDGKQNPKKIVDYK